VVGSGSDRRVLKTTLAAGAAVVQRLELATSPTPTNVGRGILRIETDPPGLAIKVDGIERGMSPVTLQNVTVGEHAVTLASGRESVQKSVTVQGGQTLSLVLSARSPGQPPVSAGWLTVAAPVALEILEDGKLLGSTESERLLVAAGTHALQFANSELGFSQRMTVNVAPGKVSAVSVKVPDGTLNLNAQPWAEVWVDGIRVGETPIGNLVRPIGRHQVLFRHPELGERREVVTVTAVQPVRLGVDMRQKSQ
jgi:serine/threonine-protein kinase